MTPKATADCGTFAVRVYHRLCGEGDDGLPLPWHFIETLTIAAPYSVPGGFDRIYCDLSPGTDGEGRQVKVELEAKLCDCTGTCTYVSPYCPDCGD